MSSRGVNSSDGEYLSSHSRTSSFFGVSFSSARLFLHLQDGVLFNLLLYGLYKLKLRELEQLDGLLQLGCQHQLLRELLGLLKFQH